MKGPTSECRSQNPHALGSAAVSGGGLTGRDPGVRTVTAMMSLARGWDVNPPCVEAALCSVGLCVAFRLPLNWGVSPRPMTILVTERGTRGLCSVLEMGDSHVFHRPFNAQVVTRTGKRSPAAPPCTALAFFPTRRRDRPKTQGMQRQRL